MFKMSSKTLLIVFLLMLVLAVVFIYYDSTHEERTFEKDIVNIDTAKVTSILLYPKVTNHKEVKIFKEGNYWHVRLDNNKNTSADEAKVRELLNQLLRVKASSLAAKDESKWNEYQVDSTGTRIKIFEGNKNTLDLIIGKFTFRQPRTMASYVRLKGDKYVYEVENFMDFAFNRKPNEFRVNKIVGDDYTHWKKLTFSYPADSSFQMVKDTSDYWTISNIRTDSAKTIDFLRTLSNTTSNEFIDDPDQTLLLKPAYTLTIESSAIGSIVVQAFADTAQMIIRSSQNSEAYFDGKANALWKKIYPGKNQFFKK